MNFYLLYMMKTNGSTDIAIFLLKYKILHFLLIYDISFCPTNFIKAMKYDNYIHNCKDNDNEHVMIMITKM